MANSICLARRRMTAQRKGNDDHVPLIKFRASPCQEYAEDSCDEICPAFREELTNRSQKETCNLIEGALNSVIEGANCQNMFPPHDELQGFKQLHHGIEFYDDVYGRPLEKERAIQARKLEIEFFKMMNVYSTLSSRACAQLSSICPPRILYTINGLLTRTKRNKVMRSTFRNFKGGLWIRTRKNKILSNVPFAQRIVELITRQRNCSADGTQMILGARQMASRIFMIMLWDEH